MHLYLKSNKRKKSEKNTLTLLEEKIKEAKAQLNRYDVTTVKNFQDREFLKVVLVYRAWELVYCESL